MGAATPLTEIVEALREVETTLEQRARRADATILMVWGLVGLVVFGFLQLAEWQPALKPYAPWSWIAPVVAGRVAVALVQVRRGRMGAPPPPPRDRALTIAARVLALATFGALLVAGATRYVPALALVFVAARLALLALRDRPLRPWADGLVACSLVGALALAARPQPWGHLVVAALFGGGFLALGLLKWHAR